MAATEAADAGEKPTTSGLPRFSIPSVAFNAGGWGPMSLPERFASVPYAYFTKGDRLGKVADFTSRARARREEDDDDEDRPRDDVSWTTVDQAQTRKKWDPRKRWQRGRPRPLTAAAQRGYDDKEKLGDLVMGKQRAAAASTHNKRNKKLREARWAGRPRYDDRNKVTRKLSVNVETDWVTIESAELSALAKLKSSAPPVEDLKWCGNLCTYDDRSFDRITTRTAPALRRFEDREFFYVSSRWDPVIEDLAKSGAGNVFATDALLAQIMASPRSVFPWDIVITCLRGKIFFDVRDAAEFEFLTVNETAHEPPNEEDSEGINSQAKLSIEASMINQNFGQQVLREAGGDGEGETKAPDGKPLETNPFWDADDSEFSEPAKLAYRYRRWDLGDDIKLVARTTVHSVVRKADKQSLATVFALNEWDSRSFGAQPWRKIIDSQRGAVMATELKNNAMKLAKWTAASILAGADQMRIGYVSREHPGNPHSHKILGTQLYMVREFSHQVSLDVGNMWGIFKWLVQLVRRQGASMASDGNFDSFVGKFVLLKTEVSSLRLYSVPMEWGDDDESEEESDDDDEDDDEGAAGGAGGAR